MKAININYEFGNYTRTAVNTQMKLTIVFLNFCSVFDVAKESKRFKKPSDLL